MSCRQLLNEVRLRQEARPALVRRRPGQPRPEVARGAALRARPGRARGRPCSATTTCTCVTQYEGFERARKDDTLDDVLGAPDAKELVDWLRTRPMMHADGRLRDGARRPAARSGAIEQALALAKEVEAALRAADYREFLKNMYGSKPEEWSDALDGLGPPARDRQRDDSHALLRARGQDGIPRQGRRAAAGLPAVVRDAAGEGERRSSSATGRSSACGCDPRATCLDSGCVWGGSLSALRLEDRTLFQVPCARLPSPGRRVMADCVFCRIVAKQIPASVVHEDEHTLAFMDLGQVNPGHVLVAAKAHAENLYALDDTQAAAVFRTAAKVARALRDAFSPEGLSVYQANGKAAGQTVFHFHMHLVPRHENDGMNLTWPVKNPPRDKLEDAAARIRARLR